MGQIKLDPSVGDQSLSQYRVVVREVNKEARTAAALNGLPFIEGRSLASTSLVPFTADALLVFEIPSQFSLAYGVFTSAIIDRQTRRVSGAPLRYAEARRQLAVYFGDEAASKRGHIEGEVMNGFALTQHPQFVIDARFVLGWFEQAADVQAVLSRIEVATEVFEGVDLAATGSQLGSLFRRSPAGERTLQVGRQLVAGTIEGLVLGRMRMLRWQGLAALGYMFQEGRQEIAIEQVPSISDYKYRLDEIGRRLASSTLFVDEIAWLKTYIAHSLELMRVELDGAELMAD